MGPYMGKTSRYLRARDIEVKIHLEIEVAISNSLQHKIQNIQNAVESF
jgi:hypothetical protein